MSQTDKASSPKWMRWTGIALTVLPAALFVFSASGKLSGAQEVIDSMVGTYGYPNDAVMLVGVLELTFVALFLVPQTAVLGAMLLTAYLGGATATHVRADEPFVMPIVVGVVIWAALWLRDARLRELVPLRRLSPSASE